MKQKNILILILAFFVAFLLMLLPLPNVIQNFRPQWFLLVLVCWTIYSQEDVSLATIWLLSLIVDLLHGSLLGLHGLALVPIAYVLHKFAPRFTFLSLAQQMVYIFILAWLNAFIPTWIGAWSAWAVAHSLEPIPHFGAWVWGSSFTTALIWPIFSTYLTRQHAISKT